MKHAERRYAVIYADKYGSDLLFYTLNSNRRLAILDLLETPHMSSYMAIDGTFKTAWKAAKRAGYYTAKVTLSWEGR